MHQDLASAAATWDKLADEQEAPDAGPGGHARAQLWRNAAESLRVQQVTGVAVCACHLIPLVECAARKVR